MHTEKDDYYRASKNPIEDIALVTYAGQPQEKRMYKAGYERYMDSLPILRDEDKDLNMKLAISKDVMKWLSRDLRFSNLVAQHAEKQFERTILAIESPEMIGTGHPSGASTMHKEGIEIIVAKWKDGASSPIHGHARGFIYEELLFGKMVVNLYNLQDNGSVRLAETKLYTEKDGEIASSYTKKDKNDKYLRQALIHNFRSVGDSVSLHYVPEHTRDGRDNQFPLERFKETIFVDEIDSIKAMYSQVGDVILVRSENVPYFGDHFIVISGAPVMKEHGLRPQDIAIEAPNYKHVLGSVEPKNGLTLLKLSKDSASRFKEFHGIKI